MNALDKIVEAYTQADDERRLYMYLAHRELRNRFIEIELAEAPLPAAPSTAAQARPARGLPRFYAGCLRLCGFAK